MKTRNLLAFFGAAVILLFITATAFGATEPQKAADVKKDEKAAKQVDSSGEIIEYVIAPGDTLWDLSNRFYSDPWLWPKIWELNPYVVDPHWIYPNNKLRIAVSAETMPVYQQKKKKMVETTIFDFTPLFDTTFVYDIRQNNVDFITPKEFKGSGKIWHDFDQKIALGDNDRIRFRMDKAVNVQIGDILTAFRISQTVKDTVKGKTIGYLVDVLGEVKTTDAQVMKDGSTVFTGDIISSTTEITPGDYLVAMPRNKISVSLKKTKLDLNGHIILTTEQKMAGSQHELVFINLGLKDGVEIGNSFSVFKPSDDPQKEPSWFVGNLIVLRVENTASTCLVTNSMREFGVGYEVRSDID